MLFIKYYIPLFLFLFIYLGTESESHPVLDYPKGGESFQAGENIIIQWHIAIEHEQEDWDLYFSPDGGQTWDTIVEDIPPATMEYSWNLPEINSNNAVIRIVMDNVEGIMDYEDISSGFSIEREHTITGTDEIPGLHPDLNTFPNPFATKTEIQFTLLKWEHVILSIYNYPGSETEILVDKKLQPGSYEILWDGTGRSSGIYLCRLKIGEMDATTRMILIH